MKTDLSTMVVSDLFNVLGLSIDDSTGRLFDNDKYQYLIFNNNYIVLPNAVIRHRRDTVLDLFGNNKLMEYLLNVMICKETEENGLYIQVLATEESQSRTSQFMKKRLIAKTNMGEFQTALYYNYCLCCIDLIFKLAQFPEKDLRPLDYSDKYIEQRIAAQQSKTKGRNRR